MEKRTSGRHLTKNSAPKRLLAFLLATAMILTNIGSDLNVTYAGTAESTVFEIRGSDLVNSIETAVADGNEVKRDNLDFTNGRIEKFENLFFGEGKVYEAYPELDGGEGMDTELRVFVRLPENADDMYMVTGDEEIIFLYINNSPETVRCSTNITRMEDGVEKVKKTKSVTIKSYESAFGDEETNIITKPMEATPADSGKAETPGENNPSKEGAEAPGTDENVTAPEGSRNSGGENEAAPGTQEGTSAGVPAKATVGAPEEASAGAPEEASAGAPEKAPSEAPTETPEETSSGASAETPAEAPAETPAGTSASERQPAVDGVAGEAESGQGDDSGKPAAPETESSLKAEPDTETAPEGGFQATVSRHHAPLVADNEEGKAEPDAVAAQAPAGEDKLDAPAQTDEPKAGEPSAAPEETAPAETSPAVTAPEETLPEETPEAAAPPSETLAPDAPAPDSEETAAPSDETTAPEETKPSDTAAAETEAENPRPDSQPSAATPSQGNQAEVAGTSDLVGMGYCSTAKVTATTLNQLKALDDFDGYKVTYTVTPPASARIVEGPRGVEEGGTLVFGVKNQIGYAVENVTANGMDLTADSVLDNEDGSQTAWYSVPDIYEEQAIEVKMAETGEHPEFEATLTMEDGMVIKLSAEEGVLPAGVTAKASVVYGIEDVVKENVEMEAAEAGETKEVVKALSYNIDLLDKDGHKLDNQIWNGSVLVTFTGAPVEENSKDADAVEIMYVATTKEDEAQADVTAKDVVSVEKAAEPVEVPGDESVGAVAFEAEHFSVYTVTFTNLLGWSKDLTIEVVDSSGKAIGESDRNWYLMYDDNSKNVSAIASGIRSDMHLAGYSFTKATIGKNIHNTAIGSFKREGSNLYAYTEDNGKGQVIGEVNQSTQIYFWFTFNSVKIIFDANGGIGGPTTVSIDSNTMTLPEPEAVGISREGWTFVGWSTASNGRGELFTAGVQQDKIEAGTKYYAIWMNENGTDGATAYFYIRKDGEIQYEPAGYPDSQFYPRNNATTLKGKLKTPVAVNNNLEKVAANILKEPDQKTIKKVLNDYGVKYEIGKQKIVWYVIKPNGGYGSSGKAWNVDGVIRDIEKHELKYDPNKGNINVPGSNEYAEGTVVNVSFDKIPLRDDYDFIGWDENPDATVPMYAIDGENNTIVMPNHDVTLYAIWQPKGKVTINYKVAMGKGKVTVSSEKVKPDSGSAMGSTAEPALGYNFGGWYSDKECSNLLSGELTYRPSKSGDVWVNGTTFYAKFVVDQKQGFDYTVKYVSASGKDLGSLAAVNKKAEEPVNATAREISGYTLKSTKSEPNVGSFDGTTKAYSGAMPNENLTVTYTYEVDQKHGFDYTIKYVSASGKDLGSLAAVNKKAEEPVNATAREIPGYTLKSAKSEPNVGSFDGTTKAYSGAMPNENLTVTYTYEVDQKHGFDYTVKYVSASGKDLGSLAAVNKKAEEPVNATAKGIHGYTLKSTKSEPNVGSFDGTTKAYSGTMPNENLTVTYTYEVDQKHGFDYTVKYVSTSGKDLGSLAAVNKKAEEPVNATAKEIPGYTLKSTKSEPNVGSFDGTTKAYSGAMPNENLTVTYTYEVDQKQGFDYTVKYVSASGKDLGSLAAVNKKAEEPVNATAKEIPGYTLKSEKSEPNVGSFDGTTQAYSGTMPNEKLTVTYTYEVDQKQGFDYTVKYVSASGKDLGSLAAVNKKAEEPVNATAKEIPGYTLKSEKSEPNVGSFDGTTKAYSGAMPNENLTVTYTYEVDQKQGFDYTVKYVSASGKDLGSLATVNKKAEEPVNATAKEIHGYTLKSTKSEPNVGSFDGTTQAYSGTMPNENLTVTYTYEVDQKHGFDYTVKYVSASGKDLGSLAAVNKKAEEPVNATAREIPGYTLKSTKSEPNVGSFDGTTKAYSGTMPNENLKVTYTYEVDQKHGFDYTVKYVSASGKDLGSLAAVNKKAEEPVKATAKEIPGYTLKSTKSEPNVGSFAGTTKAYSGTMPNENLTVTYIYEENEKLTINYQSALPAKGTVTRPTESIAPATGAPKGSEAKPADGYVFTHWTNSNGETVAIGGDNRHYTPVKNSVTGIFEPDTYTAHFTERGDLSYKVEYYYDGILGNDAVSQDNVKFGTPIPHTTAPREYKDSNYIFERTEGPQTVGSVSQDNVLKVYYVLDATGTVIPGTPDGVPDQFQVTFKYEANSNGNVSGTLTEVHTIQEFERDAVTGEIRKVGAIKPATPKADVQAAANNRYTFSYWNIRGNADKHFKSTDEIKAQSFTTDVTFAANFVFTGGGDSGGGSPSGGGPSGAKPETGGPGVVTINPDSVPLAQLPGAPAGITIIDDGEIPLAALPKTGQSNVKTTLTMMLSGILLVLTAMNKRRKEQDR